MVILGVSANFVLDFLHLPVKTIIMATKFTSI